MNTFFVGRGAGEQGSDKQHLHNAPEQAEDHESNSLMFLGAACGFAFYPAPPGVRVTTAIVSAASGRRFLTRIIHEIRFADQEGGVLAVPLKGALNFFVLPDERLVITSRSSGKTRKYQAPFNGTAQF
ncbi:MAG: hypothetical protein ACRD11_10235 [Terriglobia bacterium]